LAGLFADGAVDRFAQQVCVTGVAGCLLDEVEKHPAEGPFAGPLWNGREIVEGAVDDPRATALARVGVKLPEIAGSSSLALCQSQSSSLANGALAHGSISGRPRNRLVIQSSSTRARCLSIPPSVIVDGASVWLSCSWLRPAAFSRIVARC
jgi:hypothetical protein